MLSGEVRTVTGTTKKLSFATVRCLDFIIKDFKEPQSAINENKNKEERKKKRIKAVKVPLPLQGSQLR